MENLTTGMSQREYALLAAEADALGMTVDELATQLARDALKMRYCMQQARSTEVIVMPTEKMRASIDPAGGRHEPEKSQETAPPGAKDC